MIGGLMLALIIVVNVTNTLNKHKVQESTTIIVDKSVKQGSVWYVNDMILDLSFKRGFFNPQMGDNLEIGLDVEGRVVDWKVNN